VGHLPVPYSKGRLLALPANIMLYWKVLTLSYTLAYWSEASVTKKKCFIILPPRANVIKLFSQ
jgi:hypothetical protein